MALNAPDGTPLVRELTFSVPPGRSVLVMGPNGSGKSSLFRVLSGLWPLQVGLSTPLSILRKMGRHGIAIKCDTNTLNSSLIML